MPLMRRHPPLQEQAYHALRTAILKGQLRPGQRLTEVELAERFGISRNPVREAMRRLQQDGLVEFSGPSVGARVSSLSEDEYDDLSRLRAAIEGVAAGLAAKRMTEHELADLDRRRKQFAARSKAGHADEAVEADYDFHRGIYVGAHSPKLALVLDGLHAQITQFRKLTLSIPRRVEAATRGHEEIFEVIRARDSAKAERLMRGHIEEARAALRRHMKELAKADPKVDAKARKSA